MGAECAGKVCRPMKTKGKRQYRNAKQEHQLIGTTSGVSTESLPVWIGYGYYVRLWHQRTNVYCLHTKP